MNRIFFFRSKNDLIHCSCEIESEGSCNDDFFKIIIQQISETIEQQTIFWSDTGYYHWASDYELPCGVWVENLRFNNGLRECECYVFI